MTDIRQSKKVIMVKVIVNAYIINSLEEIIMFRNSAKVASEAYEINGKKYELTVYQVQETGDYDLYVSRNGEGVGNKFSASCEIASDLKIVQGKDAIQTLITIAKDDIKRNEYNEY